MLAAPMAALSFFAIEALSQAPPLHTCTSTEFVNALDKLVDASAIDQADAAEIAASIRNYARMCSRVAVMDAFKGAVRKCVDDRIKNCEADVAAKNRFTKVQIISAEYRAPGNALICTATEKAKRDCNGDNTNDTANASARERSCKLAVGRDLCDGEARPQQNNRPRRGALDKLTVRYCCHVGLCPPENEEKPVTHAEEITLRCPLSTDADCHLVNTGQMRRDACIRDLSAYFGISGIPE